MLNKFLSPYNPNLTLSNGEGRVGANQKSTKMKKIEKYLNQVTPYIIPDKLDDFKNFLRESLKIEEIEYNDFPIKYAVQSMKLLSKGKTPEEVSKKIWVDGSGHQVTCAVAIIAKYYTRGAEVRNYFNSLMISDPTERKAYNDKNLIHNSTFFEGGKNIPVSVD
jgi:hypothetical protein